MAHSADSERSPVPLLRAKLLSPSLDPQHLVRPRLHRRLGKGIDHRRVTVVAGGPGYGKTSLVARYLHDDAADVVWYRLDAGDRDPQTFYAYLVEALRNASRELGERSEGLIQELRSRPDEIERLADVLIRDVEDALSGRLHVVLDRVEFLEGAELCLRLLHRIVEYLPDALHLILVGRSVPEIGLHTLVAKGTALVLPPDELLLTRDETRALLHDRLGLELRDERIAELHERTRGWVTAIKLYHQSGSGSAAELPLERAGRTPSEILDYFSEEVFTAEPEDVQSFLSAASLPAVLEPELLDEVLERDDASRLLARLHQRGLFLSTLGGPDELYAFDPLFREFLDRKLRADRGAEPVRALHRAFGVCYVGRRRIAEGLRHQVAANDAAATAEILRAHGRELLAAGLLAEVRHAAEFVAEASPNAQAHDLLGETARLAGDYASSVGHFQRALGTVDGDEALAGDERAAALQGLSFARLKLGQLAAAAEAADAALEAIGDRNPAVRARVLNTRSIVHYREGEHETALAGWRNAMAASREGQDEHLTLMIAHNLGLPHAVAGDFRRAAECFRMLTSETNRRLGPEEAAAHLNLARIATLTGELNEAAHRLDDAREIAGRLKLSAVLGDVLEAEGNLARARGRFELAAGKYAEARKAFTVLGLHGVLDNLAEEETLLTSYSGEHQRALQLGAELVETARRSNDTLDLAGAQLTFGEVAVRAGSPEDALAALDHAATAFGAAGRAFHECQARLWRGAARCATGDVERGRADIEAALRLAGRNGYESSVAAVLEVEPRIRPFVGTVPPASRLAPSSPAVPHDGETADRPDLTVRLLGGFEVFRDPQKMVPPSAWKIKKAPKLLGFLIASRGHRASKDRLVDAVWGDASPAAVKKNFHPTVSFLRRALNHGHNVPKNFVIFEAGSYRLNPGYSYAIDVDIFEENLRIGREIAARRDVRGAIEAYDRALDAYGGPFLDEWDDEWIEGPRTRTSQLHEAALGEVADLHFAAGDTEAAIARLAQLVAVAPLDEGASVQLIEALADAGRRGEVEREFRRLERALSEQLEVAPSEETGEAYRDALGRTEDS